MRRLFWTALAVSLGLSSLAHAQVTVPPGNRSAEQPPVPGASARRTAANKTSYERKYQKVYTLLKRDGKLRGKIVEAAGTFGIDPLHVVGAIVGEHTYNVDAYDRLQTYYVKAVSYLKSGLSFDYEGESVAEFVQRPQFSKCSGGSEVLWSCRERVWEAEFRGQSVGGKSFPDNRFSAVFFQPFYAGQTFGLGQLNPLTALKMSDLVQRRTGLPALTAEDPDEVYRTIMDPDLTLPYVAATLADSIAAYRDIAGFDISQNPGITATLYNLGNPEDRAQALSRENAERAAKGEEPRMPQENYYGWLVNEKLDELRTLF
ncbi:MAG: hypothetical protein DI629_11345 [Mesorhizobium amorphae]|nr:MAG: hypothetical protein DI629_11345 [Mesorhizobium amorphae]